MHSYDSTLVHSARGVILPSRIRVVNAKRMANGAAQELSKPKRRISWLLPVSLDSGGLALQSAVEVEGKSVTSWRKSYNGLMLVAPAHAISTGARLPLESKLISRSGPKRARSFRLRSSSTYALDIRMTSSESVSRICTTRADAGWSRARD